MSEKFNPIDKDKVAEVPSLLPYAHHVGSAIIRPMDKGKTVGIAMKAMYQQTDTQLHQIKEQVETLIRQAQAVHDRISVSEKIYKADCGFKPIPGYQYYLYERKNGQQLISMVTPQEWGQSMPYTFIAKIELLADSTWKVLEIENEL